jgi:hypothetical protein
MNNYTKRIIKKIQQKSDEVSESKTNSWDEGYIFGLQTAITLIEWDYIHNNKSTTNNVKGPMFKFQDPNDVLNGKF